MPTNTRATLLGLSAELRLDILRQVFHHYLATDIMTVFHIHTNAYNMRPFSYHYCPKDNYLGILRTCKRLHEEGMELLYAQIEVLACVKGYGASGNLEPLESNLVGCAGPPRQMSLWKYIKSLTLCVFMPPERRNGPLILQRLKDFMENAVECGRNLHHLKIMLLADDDEPMPRYLDQVLSALQALRVRRGGHVSVTMEYHDEYAREWEGYGKECAALERAITENSTRAST